MRGVVSLAAAITLPQTLANGSPFAQRHMIIFLAFSVILQGLTLPPLIRALGVAGTSNSHPEEREARRKIVQAALDHLEQFRSSADSDSTEAYHDLAQHYRHRLATFAVNGDGNHPDGGNPNFYKRFIELSRELLRVERETAIRMRNQGPHR
jgi:monovalent cation/hydrogen antiporter